MNNLGISLQHLSERQKTNIDKFKQQFPDVTKLYNFFAPSMWGYAIAHTTECLTYPCITLRQVDDLYHCGGVAQNIVRNQFVGLYQMTTAKEEYNVKSANIAADLFIAKYGHECTLYDIMLYFGNYITEYKSSFAQFDMQDILLQYNKKFLPWKRARMGQQLEDVPKLDSKAPTGKDGLEEWLRKSISNGDDVRKGGLYSMGFVTEADVQRIEPKIRTTFFIFPKSMTIGDTLSWHRS